ncbi:hypothetical protein PMAYCL1PPCAC_24302 [Pristionchus mayeri]|uniref:Elongation factor-like 1 n=1 Tax=Pristionchus mayeri TaxID=1317129 RepID=A0AAN5D0V7_9BILA|nr:hypothetical protein PMAYCL1PPCAC_24302 [Pristionchus mayeri]
MATRGVVDAIASAVPRTTRNVSLIAHVDHGKTTFADSLLASNGIVSSRQAGKLRLLDSRTDEQERGITMKASATSLVYPPLLVNLVDSPGHVDFSGEVADALVLADISLLLLDVVEGVCSQTESVLRRAVIHGQQVVLVLNKMDRLRWELQLDEAKAYAHVKHLIEAANSCLAQVLRGLLLADESWGCIEEIEEKMHFSPSNLNVLFSSASHSFAFSLLDFAEIYSPKLELQSEELVAALFDDFYLSGKKIMPDAYSKGKKTVFEQLVLTPLWQIFDAGGKEDTGLAALQDMAKKLGLVMKSRRVGEAMDEFLRSWLPLPRATFRLVARCESAGSAMNGRRLRMLCGEENELSEIVRLCDKDGPVVFFVAKLIQADGRRLCLSRIFSGTLREGDCLFTRSARKEEVQKVRVRALWLMRGRELIPLRAAAAGVVVAVEMEEAVPVLSTCTQMEITQGMMVSRDTEEPLVRVRISARRLEDEQRLREALKTVSFFDAGLRVREEENGELALITAGEVHLEKCLEDLRELGMDDLVVSAPIVPFLETVSTDPTLTRDHIEAHLTECHKGDSLHLRLRVVPLPEEMASLIGAATKTIREGEDTHSIKEKILSLATTVLPSLKGSWWYKQTPERIRELFSSRLWSLGAEKAPENVLINAISDYERRSAWGEESSAAFRELDSAIVTGYELFVSSGPLCNERMKGVAVVVEEWKVDVQESGVSGQLMAAMKATCTAAAKKTPLRLVAAMYRCVVATSSTALGKVHAVLAQRKAKITSEDVDELTGLFLVRSLMPVVESFSLCDQLRKKTSGLATGQVEWSHWQLIDEDPYWQPTTEEEVEEFGMKGDSPNHARGYMDAVRRRKGLPTEDLIVVSAEKQRNLSMKK